MKCILLRSSWQVVNIGDIAHTPGVMALIAKHIPEAEVILWASKDMSDDVIAMEHKKFPTMNVVKGTINDQGIASNDVLAAAIEKSDFLLHGSGASLVAYLDVEAYVKFTGKPYGVFGITYSGEEATKPILNQSKFIFFRDTKSLARALDDGIHSEVMEFGPDGAFSFDITDDVKAEKFLEQNSLEKGKFLCCIPRLRYTPYWDISGLQFVPERHAKNEEMKEHDHKAMREAIISVVRETDLKVLICPEDLSHIKLGREILYDKLPDDVKKKVVCKNDFWLTDEALSVYKSSAGLFGNEMHSPIICISHGIPAVVCRWKEQTTKGYMWNDIGIGEWLFDLDNDEDLVKIAPAVLEIAKNQEKAVEKTRRAMEIVRKAQGRMCEVLRQKVTQIDS